MEIIPVDKLAEIEAVIAKLRSEIKGSDLTKIYSIETKINELNEQKQNLSGQTKNVVTPKIETKVSADVKNSKK